MEWTVSVVDADGTPTLPMRASYGSLHVSLTGPSEGTQVQVSSTTSWLKVRLDYLGPDGYVPLITEENDTDRRREATLVFKDASDPAKSAALSVVQLSDADSDTNGEEARDVLYVGYGYDVYKALDNPMAVCTTAPVLDYERMLRSGGTGIYIVVQDCHLSRTDTKYVASNDIHAYGENLTRQQTGDDENDIEGCREDCLDAVSFTEPAFGELQQQNFGHGSLEKAVAARVVDKGALLDLKRRNQTPYSSAFVEYMVAIRSAKTAEKRKSWIDKTLDTFGTHVIIQVDLGGRIDYTFTMTKEGTFETYDDMMKQVEYTLGRMDDSDLQSNSKVSSSKSASGAITVKGGSAATRSVLENDIRGLSPSGQIPPGHITDWLASINYSEHPERDPNLDVIHFELIPLWDLVYPEMRQEFLDATMAMVQRSSCALPASLTGMDIYEIETSDKTLFDFSKARADSSLCRILYFDGQPVLEVCNEYIPKIRTDQRVTVAYPIYYNHIRLNQGIFIGDGIHQPAYVGFSGTNSYVKPFEDIRPGTVLDRFYYVNGNLMLQSPSSVGALKGSNPVVRSDAFYFVYGDLEETPIVKIGSQFWTRRDISHPMGFSEDPTRKSAPSNEYIVEDVLYAPYYNELGYYPKKNNKWIWGDKPATNFDGDPNTRWYLPKVKDIQDLYSILGFNPKSLFRGQASGFEAGFNGYYGQYNILKDKYYTDGKRKVRHAGKISVIPAIPLENWDAENIIAILDEDYKITFYDNVTSEFRHEYYPVRPVRGYMFEYPNLDKLNEYDY